MNNYPQAEQAALNLLRNRQQLGRKMGVEETPHTPPADHYPDVFLWDSAFAAIINARTGEQRWQAAAQTEISTVFEGQKENGFIPNLQITGRSRSLDPERILAFEKSDRGSNYTQPPVLALGVVETYHSIYERNPAEAGSFLTKAYPSLKKFYQYFDQYRSNGGQDKLIGVIHPHETGRDSDPTFDFIKPLRLKRKGVETSQIVDKANVAIDYLSIIAHGIKLRAAKGEVSSAREIFWVNDVMMNCMYADNLYQMAELAQATQNAEDSNYFSELASKVEQQIMDEMWFLKENSTHGQFYALNKSRAPIHEVSISNLFPLVLPNLREEQLESLLNLMDSSFNTPYPLPSVGTTSSNYDPHNRESDRLWRGPTWINTNWYLVERGLKTQLKRPEIAANPKIVARCADWEKRIIDSSKRLLDINGPSEHYNPITGEGQRKRVKNFAWSNLGYVMLQNT